MTKYNLELILKIIKEMEATGLGSTIIANKYGVSLSVIKRWWRLYQEHGETGLTTRNFTHSGEFKLSVIEYMKLNHSSLNETAIHFKIKCMSTIVKWVKIYDKEGPPGLNIERRGRHPKMTHRKKKPKKNLEPESLEALLEENERLRMENDYLKKLRVLVQARLEQQSGKKPK